MGARSLPLWLARLGAIAAICAVAGFAVGVALAAAAPNALGHRSFTIMSGSMEPAIRTGDVVVVESIAPTDARIGDVITFREPDGRTRLVTHRLRRMRIRGSTARMLTKGDANNTGERWSVPVDGRIGRVLYRIPRLGYVFAALRRTPMGFFLFLVPALLLAVYELVRIWRPDAGEGRDAVRSRRCAGL